MKSSAMSDVFQKQCRICSHFNPKFGVCDQIHENVRNYPKKYFEKCNGRLFKLDPAKAAEGNGSMEGIAEQSMAIHEKSTADYEDRKIRLRFGHIRDVRYERDGAYVAEKVKAEVQEHMLTLPVSKSKTETLICPVCHAAATVELFSCDEVGKWIDKKKKIYIVSICIAALLVGSALLTGRNSAFLNVLASIAFFSLAISMPGLIKLYRNRLQFYYKKLSLPAGHVILDDGQPGKDTNSAS